MIRDLNIFQITDDIFKPKDFQKDTSLFHGAWQPLDTSPTAAYIYRRHHRSPAGHRCCDSEGPPEC